jgi:lysine-specific demethylase/histidyl-hydroxylase NO66
VTRATTAATPPTPGTTAASRHSRPAGTGAPSSALALTLDPIAADVFLAEHWDRRPLAVWRRDPARFDGILSLADAQRLVSATGIRMPGFRLVKEGAQIPPSGYTEDIPWRPGSFSGTARVDRVAEEFEGGATIVLQGLHLYWHAAATYCRALEAELGCPVQANAYYTPASAQGFAVHHDTHDVFVLQAAGRKRWRIYPPRLELPLKSQRWSPNLGPPGEPVDDLLLEAGETLYLPRGWPHEAVTSDSESLHLTVGLHPPTRMDALRAALEACAEDVEFRRALDRDGALPDDLIERLAARLAPEAVRRRTRRRFVDGRRPILDDQLVQVRGLDRLSPDDRLERRPTVIAELEMTDAGATLVFEGKEVAFPPQASAAVAMAYGAPGPFAAADLPGLDDAGRLVLVRRLVREGFLRRLDP